MHRRGLAFLLMLATGLPCAVAQQPEAPQQGRRPPNIVLILADDLGYETLGANGGTSYHTPHLDRLAETGARFTHAFSTPLCTPSRVQIMTGRYNFRNYTRFGELDTEQKTFGNLLREAGYATAVAGKWQLEGGPEAPPHVGFDAFLLWQIHTGDFWHRYKDPVVTGHDLPRDTLEGHYGPDVFTGFVTDFITQHQDEPFFVYYPMVLPHDPFQPTPSHPAFDSYEIVGLNDTTYFGGMIRHMDAVVGQIVDHLDRLGLRENTVVLFTGDNGTDRDVVSRMGDRMVRGEKALPTVAGTHVPFIVNAPGLVKASIRDDLVDFTDVLPTLAEIARTSLPNSATLDGHSLWPTLTTGEPHTRRFVFCDYDGKDGQFPAGRWAHGRHYKRFADGRLFRIFPQEMREVPLADDEIPPDAHDAVGRLDAALDQMARADSASTNQP